MLTKIEPTYTIDIFMAGDTAQAKHVCREFCMRGFCIHIVPADFIYTGGEETGFKIGIVNYPRFPSLPADAWAAATELAELLIERQGCGFEVWYGVRSDESPERAVRYRGKVSNAVYAPHEFMPKMAEKE